MFRKLIYLLIVGSLYLAGLLLVGCFQSNQSSSVMVPSTTGTVTSVPPTATPLSPTPTPEARVETLRVNQLTASALTFKKDEFVLIQPGGEVKVGPFVGFVGPEGRDSLLLASYSIVPNIPHGALLCRIKGQENWSCCPEEIEVQFNTAGQLEFQVNDNDQGNNDPDTAFMVQIVVASYSVKAQQESQMAQRPANQPSNDNVRSVTPIQIDNVPVDSSNPSEFRSQTEGCQDAQGGDPRCQSLCLGRHNDPNCIAADEYNQDQQQQKRFEDEERRKAQEQEEQQRRQQEEAERQRQQQDQQQNNSPDN